MTPPRFHQHQFGWPILQFVIICSWFTIQSCTSFINTDTRIFGNDYGNGEKPEQAKQRSTTDRMEPLESLWSEMITHAQPTLPAIINGTFAAHNSALEEYVTKFGVFLRKFAESELGVEETKAAYESVSFDMRLGRDPLEQVQKLANKLQVEMKVYQDALDSMVTAAKLSYETEQEGGLLPLCCDLSSQGFRFDNYYKTQVSTASACWAKPRGRRKVFVPGNVFSDVLRENHERLPNIRWQYFVSPDGVQVQFPASKQNCPKINEKHSGLITMSKPAPEMKSWLVQKSSIDTQIHRIIFLIQLDRTTDSNMIKSIKNIVLGLLKLLDESDEVGIISSESDQLWSKFICDQMLKTSSWTRFQIMNYLAYLENRYKNSSPASRSNDTDPDNPDHYVGLEKSVSMACKNSSESSSVFPPCATTIIHLSSSVLAVEKFRPKSLKVNCPIFIEALFFKPFDNGEEEKFRKAMQNVASKNIWRVQVFSSEQTDPSAFAEKVATQLNTKKEWWSFSDILSQFLPHENNFSQNIKEFSLPHWNHVSKELVVGAKRFVFHDGKPLGLISVEIPLAVFTQHVSSIEETLADSRNYAFIVDRNGKIVMHPAFGKPELSKGLLSSVSIEEVEISKGFPSLKRRILSEKTGCASLRSDHEDTWITYTWANSLNYVIVLALFGDSGGCGSTKHEFILRKNALSTNEVQHHLLLEKSACCYNHRRISPDKAGLYLAPTAFVRPADATSHDELRQDYKRVLSLMAYIGDHSGMIQNPRGELKPSVKHHIGVLASTVQTWKQSYFQSDWNKYILRRFASGDTGNFLLIYPGQRVSSGYVPSSMKWFKKAVGGEGKLIFLPPRFDTQVGLPVVTISQVVVLNLKTPFSQVKTPVAVVGADLNAGFLQKLMDDMFPECMNSSSRKSDYSSNSNFTSHHGGTNIVRCFLIDESGTIIYHPHLVGSLHKTSEVHLTQLEPLSVIDILQQSQNNGSLMKYMCHKVSEASVTQGSLKRMYKFSINARGISKQQGELCNMYSMVPVPGTNVILGVVRDNCSSGYPFCPCSRVDNLCLNCLRMDQSDCECPCECPREPSFCTRKGFVDLPENIVPCEFPSEDIPMTRLEATNSCNLNKSLENVSFPCDIPRNSCSSLVKPATCVGSWDCEWCEVNSMMPTCAKYSDCYDLTNEELLKKETDAFRGDLILDDQDYQSTKSDSQITMVPVLGVLSVFIVFIVLAVYCYRHRALTVADSQPNLYLLPLQDNLVGLDSPAIPNQSESDSDSENVQLPVPVARVSRRRHVPLVAAPPPRSPVASTVSDLGYSTMTGENASECGARAGPCLAYSIPPPLPRPHSSLPHVETSNDSKRQNYTKVKTSTDTFSCGTAEHELATCSHTSANLGEAHERIS